MEDEIVQVVVDERSNSVPRMRGEDNEDFLARSTGNHESRDKPLAFWLSSILSHSVSIFLSLFWR